MMYFEPPQLAYWDSTKNNWRLDALTDSQYNEGKLNVRKIFNLTTKPLVVSSVHIPTYALKDPKKKKKKIYLTQLRLHVTQIEKK